jgi:hypothetical protein
MGDYLMDLGASWIHGTGPGLISGASTPSSYKGGTYNPIFEIAINEGIEVVPTWENLDSR